MKEPEMDVIAGWIAEVLASIGTSSGNTEVEQRIRKQVAELAGRFAIYESRVRGIKCGGARADALKRV